MHFEVTFIQAFTRYYTKNLEVHRPKRKKNNYQTNKLNTNQLGFDFICEHFVCTFYFHENWLWIERSGRGEN